jgi:hypothetical protein
VRAWRRDPSSDARPRSAAADTGCVPAHAKGQRPNPTLLEEPVARVVAGTTLELRRSKPWSRSKVITTRGDEQCFAIFNPSPDAAGLATDVETARERLHVRPRTLAGPWIATNADGDLAAVIVFDHLWRNGRIELDGATIEVRHRQRLRGGYHLTFEDRPLLSICPRHGLRVVATLELATYVPAFPPISPVLVMACVFSQIATVSGGG